VEVLFEREILEGEELRRMLGRKPVAGDNDGHGGIEGAPAPAAKPPQPEAGGDDGPADSAPAS
jgi:hypothetical protein